MDIYELLRYITRMSFPQITEDWELYHIDDGMELFQKADWYSSVSDYISEYYRDGLNKLMQSMEKVDSTCDIFTLTRQLLISLANCTINRRNDSIDHKPRISYLYYKNNDVFRDATIEYAIYAPQLVSNLLAYSFFEVDFEMVKRVYSECIKKYRKSSKEYKTLVSLLRDKFNHNQNFSLIVGQSTILRYWEIAEFVNSNIPKLSFYKTEFGEVINAIKMDMDEVAALAPLRKLVEDGELWVDIEKLPSILEFDYIYPNGSKGDMIRYILDEYGEHEQKSATMWHGKISKDFLDLFEIFSEVAWDISEDVNFLRIYEHHNASILKTRLSERHTIKIRTFRVYKEIEQMLLEYRIAQKRKRTDLYSKLIQQGRTTPKWKTEAQLFAIVSSLYPDAIYQYRCKWLGSLSLDVFIPSQSVGIEYQGKQHYAPIEHFGGERHFERQQENDKQKRNLCVKHGVKLIEWPYTDEVTESSVKNRLAQEL